VSVVCVRLEWNSFSVLIKSAEVQAAGGFVLRKAQMPLSAQKMTMCSQTLSFAANHAAFVDSHAETYMQGEKVSNELAAVSAA